MVEAAQGIAELAKALAKAQGDFPPIPKNKTTKVRTKTGAEYSYNYADLPTILDLTRKPLSENGLSVAQMTVVHDGAMVLLTRLMHTSGQFIESTYPLPINATAQDMGSAITYARRYSLAPLIGIAPDDDDDGKAAQENEARPSAPPPANPKALPGYGKQPKAKEDKKPPPDSEKGLASVTIKSIAPGNHPSVKFSKLETSAGTFIVMGENPNFTQILKDSQAAALSKALVVIESHVNAKGSSVVDSLRMEGA